MRLRQYSMLLPMLGAALFSAACSTVTIRVPVMRPAEINLRGKSELIISEIKGQDAAQVNNLLKDAVVSSGRFKLVDRQHLDKVMGELSLSNSDLASSDGQKKLGQLMTGSILLIGNVERSQYEENTQRLNETCTKYENGKAVQYGCVRNTRSGKASVIVGFDVIDVQTGENLKPKRVNCDKSENTDMIDNPAPTIDGRGMVDGCHREVVTNFMKSIAPWQDFVDAAFMKDGDVPQLELGINYAQRGEWADAISKFKEALEFTDKQPGLAAKSVARVHWDLGLAYEYTFQFDLAITEVKKAYDMTLDDAFLGELDNIKKLKADQDKLKDQLGAPAPAPAGGA